MHKGEVVNADEWHAVATALHALDHTQVVAAVPGGAVGAEPGIVVVTDDHLAGVTREDRPRVLWTIPLAQLQEISLQRESRTVRVRHAAWTTLELTSDVALDTIHNTLLMDLARRGRAGGQAVTSSQAARPEDKRAWQRPSRKVTTAVVLGTLVVAGTITARSASAQEVVVSRVVDGDTIDVLINGGAERIRLLNIDTPETVDPNRAPECLGAEATTFLKRLLPVGSEIALEFDRVRTDSYGRTLAAVKKDGLLVNAEIARAGLGVPVTVGANSRWRGDVDAAFDSARDRQVGFFDPTIECTLPAAITAAEQASPGAAPEPGAGSSALAEAAAAHAAASAAWLRVDSMVNDTDSHTVRALGTAAIVQVAARADREATRHRGLHSHMQAREAEQRTAEAKAAAEAKEKAQREAKAKAAAKAQREAKAQAEAKAKAARERAAQAEAARQRAQGARNRQSAQRPAPSRPSTNPPSSGSGGGKYTGCRRYAPGGKTWTPIPCP